MVNGAGYNEYKWSIDNCNLTTYRYSGAVKEIIDLKENEWIIKKDNIIDYIGNIDIEINNEEIDFFFEKLDDVLVKGASLKSLEIIFGFLKSKIK